MVNKGVKTRIESSVGANFTELIEVSVSRTLLHCLFLIAFCCWSRNVSLLAFRVVYGSCFFLLTGTEHVSLQVSLK